MNKLYAVCLSIIFILSSSALFAVEKEFTGKLGTSYSHKLDNWGLDVSLNYMYKLDPWFVAGFEGDFYWVRWEKLLGTKEEPIGVYKEIISDSDAFVVPMFFNAQVRLPFLVKKIYVEPYVTVGLGYTLMILTYKQPSFVDSNTGETFEKQSINDFHHGFAWQFLASVAFKPGEDSRIKFIADFGYRGTSPEKDNVKVNLSGMLMRLGVQFDI